MTDSQRDDVLTAYVRDVADRLGLRDWVLHVETGPKENSDFASSTLFHNTREGTLTFREDRFENAEELRADVVHECLHPHLWSCRNVVCADLFNTALLPRGAFDLLKQTYEREMETAIEAITVAIAPFFPLIEWGVTDGEEGD